MIVFYILAILIFGFVIVNFILDCKAPQESVEAVLIDKKIESFYVFLNKKSIKNHVISSMRIYSHS